MIVGTLRILAAPERRAEVLRVFRGIQGARAGPARLRRLPHLRGAGAEPAVVLVERWESKTVLEAHLRSEAYRRILGAIELSDGPPEVRSLALAESGRALLLKTDPA